MDMTPNTMSYTVPIPLTILETLQMAFQAEAKKICREVANTLGIPTQDVVKRVCKSQTTHIQVYDIDVPPICPILAKQDSIYLRCSKPCLLGTGKCVDHQLTIQNEPTVQSLVRRVETEDGRVFWAEETTSQVYNSVGEPVGIIHDGELQLFRYECSSSS